MSAFVIDNETMDRCVRTICAPAQHGMVISRFADIDTRAPDAMTRIGRLLFALNIDAVCERYPDCHNEPDNLPGPCDDAGHSTIIDAPLTYIPQVRRFTSKPMRDQVVDGYKALQCLRYQCNEGNIPSRPAYAALCEAISEIADEIVQSLAAYSKASWG